MDRDREKIWVVSLNLEIRESRAVSPIAICEAREKPKP